MSGSRLTGYPCIDMHFQQTVYLGDSTDMLDGKLCHFVIFVCTCIINIQIVQIIYVSARVSISSPYCSSPLWNVDKVRYNIGKFTSFC